MDYVAVGVTLVAAMLLGVGWVLQQYAAEQEPQAYFLRLPHFDCAPHVGPGDRSGQTLFGHETAGCETSAAAEGIPAALLAEGCCGEIARESPPAANRRCGRRRCQFVSSLGRRRAGARPGGWLGRGVIGAALCTRWASGLPADRLTFWP